jgi:hypothetical protein
VLSLVPFVTLMALLREADRGRTRALWFVPPLMVLWGNLHGAVLVGLAVVGAFVAFAGRRGAGARVVVGVLSLLSLVLTSAGTRTPEYYVAALSNEAAKRGTDLWARPDLTNPFDAALVFCVAVLLLMARRALRRWEWVVVLGLAVGTLLAARNGVWLLLFLAPVAGVARPADRAPEVGRLNRRVVAAALAYTVVVGVIVGAQLIRRQDDVRPPGEELVAGVRELAAAGVVLAVEPEAETFAAEGLRVWMANPIDAFEPEAQRDFLDFLHECEIPDVPLDLVVVQERCADAVHAQGWSVAEDRGDLVLFTPTQGLEP